MSVKELGANGSYVSAEKKTAREKNEYLKRFNKRSFLNYVEKQVDFDQKEVSFGKIEQVVVNFFATFIFKNGKDFIYIPEFGDAIFELLHKHEEKLPSVVSVNDSGEELETAVEVKTKFLTLAYPSYDPSLALPENIFNFSVYLTQRMKKFTSKLLRRIRLAEERARKKYGNR